MTLFSALKRFSGKNRESEVVARAFATCFRSPEGNIVLEHLHHHVLFRMNDPQSSEAQLRFAEGQRQLVLTICKLASSTPLN